MHLREKNTKLLYDGVFFFVGLRVFEGENIFKNLVNWVKPNIFLSLCLFNNFMWIYILESCSYLLIRLAIPSCSFFSLWYGAGWLKSSHS